jgi:hypothetical protein
MAGSNARGVASAQDCVADRTHVCGHDIGRTPFANRDPKPDNEHIRTNDGPKDEI